MLWKHTRDWHDAHCNENNFIDVKDNRGIGFLERIGSIQTVQCRNDILWVSVQGEKEDRLE